MSHVVCSNCSVAYPDTGAPYRCSICGGVYHIDHLPAFDPELLEKNTNSDGMWRYRYMFNLPENAPMVYLGEGNTPLVWGEVEGVEVGFKLEYLNPTGSFKDRGSALLVSFLLSRGVEAAIEDSSGNAGASFAAYSAYAGIKARVYVPDYAAGPKRAQIEAYGADVVRILGPRSNAADAVLRDAELGAIYASHAYMPHGTLAYATVAYELFEQMGEPPGTIIGPAGQGSLLLGIGQGFLSLKRAGLIDRVPRLVGVQARACAPLWAVFNYGPAGIGWAKEGETLAEGVRIIHPLRGDMLIKMISETNGVFFAVDEEEILPGRDQLARMGFFVEPTSAIVWRALKELAGSMPGPVVAILTGTGLKSYGSPKESLNG